MIGGDTPGLTSVTANRRAAIALVVVIVFQLAWGGQYIFRTSFVHSDQRVFSLWDDAMISMQYARNLRNGDGLVWNAGDEPVQGFTNLGVTLSMAAIHVLPLPSTKIALVVQLMMLCMLAASTGLVWGIVRRLYPAEPWVALGSAVAIVLCAPLGIWSLQGSDVAFVTLWLTGSVFVLAGTPPRTSRLLAVLGSGLWIRPDTALYFLVLLGAAVAVERNRRLGILGLGVLALTLGVQMGFSQLYYDDFLPNTYYPEGNGIPSCTDADLWSIGIAVVASAPATRDHVGDRRAARRPQAAALVVGGSVCDRRSLQCMDRRRFHRRLREPLRRPRVAVFVAARGARMLATHSPAASRTIFGACGGLHDRCCCDGCHRQSGAGNTRVV